MEKSSEHSGRDDSASNRQPSFTHLLLVWFLIGFSLWRVGTALVEVIPADIPLSSMGIGLLFGTVVVTVPWAFGFYPSLSASLGYFVTELSINFFSMVVIVPLFLSDFTPEMEVAVNLISITPAAILMFTDAGIYLQTQLRQHTRSLLKLPPENHPSRHD